MAVPPRDLALHLDSRQLLRRMKGPVANNLLAQQEAVLATVAKRRPEHTKTSQEDARDFLSQCAQVAAESRDVLASTSARVPSNVLLQVPLLIGQSDYARRELGPGPNQYAGEIELLARYATAPVAVSGSPADVGSALACLRAARQLNLLSTFSDMASVEERDSVAGAFAASGIFTRGRFYGAYDRVVLKRLHAALSGIGLAPPDPELLYAMSRAWIAGCSDVYRMLHHAADASRELRTFLERCDLFESASLLTDSPRLLDIMAKLSDRLWMEEHHLIRGFKGADRREASRWLDSLCFDLPSDNRADADPGVALPFARHRGRLLLIGPHRLNTDATDLVGRLWSARYKEKYYRQRGKVVEHIAYEVLSSIPGARGIQNAEYQSADGQVQGECDGLVEIEGAVFVIEAKGGFISSAARRGSIEAARSDIQDNVSEAFYQAGRLASVLRRDGAVRLRAGGGTLELRMQAVKKLYVIIPTADDMAAIATNVRGLCERGYLPDGAAPAIVAAQDMLKLQDFLQHPVELVAYFKLREEALNTSPRMMLIDENELLGGFISGVDFVAHVETLSDRESYGAIAPDVVLQRHVDVWLDARYESGSAVPPPQRHGTSSWRQILRLARSDFWAAVEATAASQDAANFALSEDLPASARIIRTPEVSVVLAQGLVRRGKQARDPDVRRLRQRSWQCWTVACLRDGSRRLLDVVRRPRCVAPEIRTPLGGLGTNFDEWYTRFEGRRRRPPDPAVVRVLEDIGVSRDLASGLARRGLGSLVAECAGSGCNPAKAAALCLGDLASPLRTVDWTSNLALAVETIALLVSRRVAGAAAAAAFECAFTHGAAPEECVRRFEVARDPVPDVNGAIAEVFASHPNEVLRAAAGDARAARYLAGQASRLLGEGRPRFEELIELVDGHAASWALDHDGTGSAVISPGAGAS